ncbi:MAG: DUF547 domain-containing protein [Bacteroidia bacterium]
MKYIKLSVLVSIFTFVTACRSAPLEYFVSGTEPQLLTLSQDLLYAIRTENTHVADSLKLQLKSAKPELLSDQLKTDDSKKAFWLNVYNAFIQDILTNSPDNYEDRGAFFSKNRINIAGYTMSFDFIEHGILRHSKNKLSLGYFNKLFPSKLEKSLRVDSLDFRIHFALNCGASSCPPIAYYTRENLDAELEMAEAAFIVSRSRVEGNTVYVSKIFSWFRADFGGKSGIEQLLIKHKVIPNDSFKLEFDDYDWNLELKKYRD